MAGGNERKGANVVILHRFVLLFTKGRRFPLTELSLALGEGVGSRRDAVAGTVWTRRSVEM